MKRLTSTLALLTALAAPAALAGCGSEDPDAASGATIDAGEPFNDADVAFASEMIPHHAQALAMVDLTRGRDLTSEVAALAEQIQAAQAPEIQTLTGWLQDWDQPVPETVRDHANAHGDEHGAGMEGMAADLDALEAASDAEFEDLWLTLMIEHHEGALTMAAAEVEDGEFADAIALAEQIAASQAEEIEQMEQLLAD